VTKSTGTCTVKRMLISMKRNDHVWKLILAANERERVLHSTFPIMVRQVRGFLK